MLATALVCILTAMQMQAQSIAGKWYCPHEFIDSMGIWYYNNKMKGNITFKKNGIGLASKSSARSTLQKNDPIQWSAAHRRIDIKVTGRYYIPQIRN